MALKSKAPYPIKLGDLVIDLVSNFSGIVTQRCEHLASDVQCGVTACDAPASESSKIDTEPKWFAEGRLRLKPVPPADKAVRPPKTPRRTTSAN